MSTAEMAINNWMQTENTLAAVETWEADEEPLDEAFAGSQADLDDESEQTLPDDFWQEWFGLWR